MPLFQKKPTIVEAVQAGLQGSFGILGALVTEDWILKSVAGTLTTMSNTEFGIKYSPAPSSASLTGDDVD